VTAERAMGILAKAADVTELLAERGPLSPADIATEIQMPRSSVYRLTEALSQAHLTETLPDSRIRLTLRWLRLADAARAGMTEWTSARAVLDDLAETTGQTAFLSLPNGDQAICVDWARGRAINVLILKPGRTLPLYAGAAGRATLAFRDEAPDDYLAKAPFPDLTPATLTTAVQLRRDVAETRDRGFSVSDEDVTIGIGALGAPLLASSGRFRGALSIAGLAEDFRSRCDDLVTELLASARVLVPPD
jgi:IclR family transcriptional regulator, acetate operon repressor